jgi:hypothetical protein
MNDVTTSAAVRAELAELSAEINQTREDAALLGRLQRAEGKLIQLLKKADALNTKLSKAVDTEGRQARDDEFAKFGGIIVTYTPLAHHEVHILSVRWDIRYKRLTWDMNTRQSVMLEHTVGDFDVLPEDVFRYLVLAKPEAIPSLITDLAPGDLDEAFHRYFMAKRRGYISQ